MIDIKKSDRIRFIKGKFKSRAGYVTRTHGDQACVVIKGIWDYGIWFDKSELKRVKRYKKEQ